MEILDFNIETICVMIIAGIALKQFMEATGDYEEEEEE